MKFIVNNTFKLAIDNLSRNAIVAKLKEAGQQLGKTSVSELLSGNKKEIKGYSIVEIVAQENELKKEVKKRGRKVSNHVKLIVVNPNIEFRPKSNKAIVASLVKAGIGDYDSLTLEMSKIDAGWTRQLTQVYAQQLEMNGFLIRQGKEVRNYTNHG